MEPSDNQLKVGLFGIGLDTYWLQFPGLRDKLIGFTAQVVLQLECHRVARDQLRVDRHSRKVFYGRARIPQSGRGPHLLICHDLRPFLDGASRGAAGQSSSDHSQFVSGASD
jgi:hypothetical protein